MHTLFQGNTQATGTTSLSSYIGQQIYSIYPRTQTPLSVHSKETTLLETFTDFLRQVPPATEPHSHFCPSLGTWFLALL